MFTKSRKTIITLIVSAHCTGRSSSTSLSSYECIWQNEGSEINMAASKFEKVDCFSFNN